MQACGVVLPTLCNLSKNTQRAEYSASNHRQTQAFVFVWQQPSLICAVWLVRACAMRAGLACTGSYQLGGAECIGLPHLHLHVGECIRVHAQC